MAELSRSSVDDADRSGGLTTGIYIARVISHLDPSFMGSIEVTLISQMHQVTTVKLLLLSTHRRFLDILPLNLWGRMMEQNPP